MRVSDGCSGWGTTASAGGEDGAVLAQPLRYRNGKVAGATVRSTAPKMMALTRASSRVARPDSNCSAGSRWKLSELLIEVARDPAMLVWLDGRLNSARDRRRTSVAKSWSCSPGGGQLHGTGRVRGGARVHRLEPAQATGGLYTNPNTYYEFVSTPTSTTRTRRRSRFRSTATEIARFLRGRPPTVCRTASISSPRWRSTRRTARRLARKLWNFFVSELETPDPAFVEASPQTYLANGTEMKPVIRVHPAVRVVFRFGPLATRAIRGRWNSSRVPFARSGGRASRLTRR